MERKYLWMNLCSWLAKHYHRLAWGDPAKLIEGKKADEIAFEEFYEQTPGGYWLSARREIFYNSHGNIVRLTVFPRDEKWVDIKIKFNQDAKEGG